MTLGSPFAIFVHWIWRRLMPFPACFIELLKYQVLHFLLVWQEESNGNTFHEIVVNITKK